GILLITHDMGVVGEIADDVVVLKDGDAVEQGGFRRILSAPEEPYTRELLAAVPRLSESLERTGGRGSGRDPGRDSAAGGAQPSAAAGGGGGSAGAGRAGGGGGAAEGAAAARA